MKNKNNIWPTILFLVFSIILGFSLLAFVWDGSVIIKFIIGLGISIFLIFLLISCKKYSDSINKKD